MNHLTTVKDSQRMEIRHRMKTLDDTYCHTSDEKIFQSVVSLPEYQMASVIFCYISVGREVDTRKLLHQAWADGKRTAVPRCIGKGIMEAYEITSYDDLVPGLYHIPEPSATCTLISLHEIDLSVVPCISCDRTKRRLGHGGGYYDRYLSGLSAPSVALCREQLLLDEVCCETHDQPVDFLITENTIYR